ncbi:MAG: aldehyde dehydrogenase family protein [Proteobacteria bacterium]|nr:aldehyde dehydrogenase family protein [Pseudomonadota bacterium]
MSASVQSLPTPECDIDSIAGHVERLRQTFRSGRTRQLDWRRAQLRRLEALVRDNGDALLEALAQDLGKPTLEAWAADIGLVAKEAAEARKRLVRWTRPEKVPTPLNARPGRSRIVREPLGVTLVIAPWNYPVQLLLSPLVGAIAAGNCAVLKPSEVAAHTSGLLARLVPEYLDTDCFQVVEGGVPETTALLAERFDHIFYTGNGRVGRIVMAAAAKHLTPVTLELGGKSPCLVDGTANLQVAARRIAWGKWLNAGQTCIAPDYVLVQRERHDELVDKLRGTIREFYGDDPKQSSDYARVINAQHHRRLAGLLKDAEVAIGGDADEGERYLAPTVITNPAPDAAVMQDEIFGPILPVLAVDNLDEALEFVNQREKPLALYVFSEDSRVEQRVIADTSSGGVCVNGTIWHIGNPHLPFGGVGESGMGAYHGHASFETFSHRKSVLTKPTRSDPKLMYPPYSDFVTRLAKRFL